MPDLDDTDLNILRLLLEDASQSFKQIGQSVHLTGQAVGARVRKLQDLGVIEGHTLRWNPEKIGLTVHAFVTVFLSSGASHQRFHKFIEENDSIAEVHRVSGEGCYWMRVRVDTSARLNDLLNRLLAFGNYKVSLSIERLKG
ncbi:Lrp/AsnC family transcriptional regulator [Paenibacillus puldeungensis]|uniref:Lrp/AsnC family transcriptional regulator n=1 Tax=Paenibacillus puldeungensis TaxID=696536 RepID=A0ABW3RS17_9BACL